MSLASMRPASTLGWVTVRQKWLVDAIARWGRLAREHRIKPE